MTRAYRELGPLQDALPVPAAAKVRPGLDR